MAVVVVYRYADYVAKGPLTLLSCARCKGLVVLRFVMLSALCYFTGKAFTELPLCTFCSCHCMVECIFVSGLFFTIFFALFLLLFSSKSLIHTLSFNLTALLVHFFSIMALFVHFYDYLFD